MDFVIQLLSKCIIVFNVIGISIFSLILVLLVSVAIVKMRGIIGGERYAAEQRNWLDTG